MTRIVTKYSVLQRGAIDEDTSHAAAKNALGTIEVDL